MPSKHARSHVVRLDLTSSNRSAISKAEHTENPVGHRWGFSRVERCFVTLTKRFRANRRLVVGRKITGLMEVFRASYFKQVQSNISRKVAGSTQTEKIEWCTQITLQVFSKEDPNFCGELVDYLHDADWALVCQMAVSFESLWNKVRRHFGKQKPSDFWNGAHQSHSLFSVTNHRNTFRNMTCLTYKPTINGQNRCSMWKKIYLQTAATSQSGSQPSWTWNVDYSRTNAIATNNRSILSGLDQLKWIDITNDKFWSTLEILKKKHFIRSIKMAPSN